MIFWWFRAENRSFCVFSVYDILVQTISLKTDIVLWRSPILSIFKPSGFLMHCLAFFDNNFWTNSGEICFHLHRKKRTFFSHKSKLNVMQWYMYMNIIQINSNKRNICWEIPLLQTNLLDAMQIVLLKTCFWTLPVYSYINLLHFVICCILTHTCWLNYFWYTSVLAEENWTWFYIFMSMCSYS